MISTEEATRYLIRYTNGDKEHAKEIIKHCYELSTKSMDRFDDTFSTVFGRIQKTDTVPEKGCNYQAFESWYWSSYAKPMIIEYII